MLWVSVGFCFCLTQWSTHFHFGNLRIPNGFLLLDGFRGVLRTSLLYRAIQEWVLVDRDTLGTQIVTSSRIDSKGPLTSGKCLLTGSVVSVGTTCYVSRESTPYKTLVFDPRSSLVNLVLEILIPKKNLERSINVTRQS